MANEIWIRRDKNLDYFINIRRYSDWQVYYPTGTAFEAFGTSSRDISDYAIDSPTDQGNGVFTFDAPTLAAGRYLVEIYTQAGASPADSDDFNGSFEVVWDGSAVAYIGDNNGRVEISGTNNNTLDDIADSSGRVNVGQIYDSANAANYLSQWAGSFVTGYKGGIILMTSGAASGQWRRIRRYYTPGVGYTILVEPDFATAPSSGDTFIIIPASGQADLFSINGSTAMVTSLENSVKASTHKASYNKSTGVVTVYDTDGATELFTFTLTDSSGVITRVRADA